MEKQKLGDNLERRDPKNPSSSSTHPSSSENHTATQENHHPLPENHRSIPSSLRQDFFWHGQSGNHRLPTQPSPENHRQAPGNHLSIPRSRRDSFPSALAQPSNHPSPENHPNIPRSRREIYPSMLPMPESNIPNLDHYRSMNHITVSPNPNVVPVNPSFRDFVRDPSFLGDEFSCMTLSDDQSSLRSPAVNSSSLLWNHSIGRELFTNLYPQSQHNITEMDLQRLRVQYAVSGMNPQSHNHLPLPRDEAARFDLINHSTNNGGNGGFGDYGGLPNNGVSYRILPNNGGNGFSTYEWQNHGGNGFAQGILPNNGGNGLSYEWQNHGGNGFAQGILPNNGGNTSFALPNNGGNGYDYEAQNYGGNGLSNDGFAHGLPNNEGDALRHGVSRNVNNRNNNSLVLDSGFQQRRRSMNGFETENSQAVYDNSPLNRSRQCQLSQWGSVVSLEELKGRVLEMAKNQQGCRWLQKKFEEGNPDDIQMIFLEVKDYVTDLMKDNFGNYFMQKFFEVCNEQQITQILVSVIRNECQFRTICLDTHGTRAVQKLLGHLRTQEQVSLVITVLRRITVTLMKSMSGNHVVHRCLELFPDEHTKHILDVIADNCMDIATDRSGCCVLQNCLDLAQGEPKERLVADITANALVLSEDPFGNYVVQYLLGREDPLVKGEVLAQLQGNFATLSMNKFSSNVVEKCLRETGEENAVRIINEIIESKQFLSVLQDPYGNYVAQCALEISKGPLRHRMVSEIQSQYSQLHSHPHGKRVLAKLKGNRHRLSM